MKNRKWLTYTLGALLTLIVLAAVGGAGFRVGMMQNVSNMTGRPAFTHNFDGDFQPPMQGNRQNDGSPKGGQMNPHQDNFRGNDRRGGGMPFMSPIFGLIRLAVLGALLWFGYKFVQKSGWKLTRVTQVAAETTAAPSDPEAAAPVSDDEKKDEA
ncbi:MAG: hypothetical protein IPO36_06260 [Anaerolineales bacterium]|nr:hypothetical protein [Anaerolineales bacterium]